MEEEWLNGSVECPLLRTSTDHSKQSVEWIDIFLDRFRGHVFHLHQGNAKEKTEQRQPLNETQVTTQHEYHQYSRGEDFQLIAHLNARREIVRSLQCEIQSVT